MLKAFENVEAAIEFSLRLFQALRESNIEVSSHQSIACVQSINSLSVVKVDDLASIYQITLVNRPHDRAELFKVLKKLIELYFSSNDNDRNNSEEINKLVVTQHQAIFNDLRENEPENESSSLKGYSTIEVDRYKDLRFFPQEELAAAAKVLEKIAKKNAALARRKWKYAKRGKRIDLRSSVKESVRYDGDIVKWRYKDKVPNYTRLVVIVDVSGSMEIYSVFLLNFLHILAQHKRWKVEVFVFSTELRLLTKYFRLKSFKEMLRQVSLQFSGWSGGTKIGQAIKSLNENYPAMVRYDTLVTVMSDGWDTGEPELLGKEMAKISEKAKSVVWINPLKGDPAYEPLAVGMAAALPFCDEFISGHSISSLEIYGKIIS